MFDQLQVFLDFTAPPELKLLLVRADQVIKQVGVNTHEDILIELLERADNEETGTMVGYINETYRDTLAEVLGRFDVWVSDNPDIHTMVEIISTLDSVNNYDDVDSLLGIVDGEEDSVVSLGMIVEEMSGTPLDETLQVVDRVGVNLMTNIKKVLTEEVDNDEVVEAKDLRDVRRRIRFFIDAHPQVLAKKGFDEGMSIGVSISAWIDRYHDTLIDLPYNRLVPELVAFALSAGIQESEMYGVVVGELESLIGDELDLTKADILTEKLVKEVFA